MEGAATPDMAGVDAREALQLVRKAAVLVAGLHELTPHLAVKLKTENHVGDVGNDTVCGEFVERTWNLFFKNMSEPVEGLIQ